MTDFVTRFAPSPTGFLHLGHAAAAFHVWDGARRAGGTVLLRIEDIDTVRCRPDYIPALLADLRWLGLDWPEPVRIQSDHFGDYAEAVAHLARLGLAYRCFRTRAELAETSGPAPIPASQEQTLLDSARPFAWRLSLAVAREHLGPRWDRLIYTLETGAGLQTVAARPQVHGDIIIARKDSPSAYHLAACHDDALQGITHVIRGEDLIDAPHIHTLLQILMDWPQPIYRHHQLVLGSDGKRLSKRNQSVSLASLRADGMTPADIRQKLGFA